MRSLIIRFFILLGLLFPALASAVTLDLTRYIPLTAGNQWIYRNNNNATQTQTVGSPVVLPGGVSAIPWAIVDSSATGYTTAYSTVDGNGFRRYQEYTSSLFISGYGNTSATATYSPAMAISPANVTVGSTYNSTGTLTLNYTNVTTITLSYSASTQIVGFETVTNYDGTQSWSALKVIVSMTASGTVNGQYITIISASTSWLVDGIGAVQIYKPNSSGVMETWKLASTNVVPTPAPAPKNYSDSWWNANESGWGITITDHGTNAFVQWYTYDQSGHNQKYVISGGTFSSDKCQFSGGIQHVTGPSWTLPTFDPNLVTRTIVGVGTFDFCPVGLPTGTVVFNYSVDGVTGSKQLTRLSFGNDVPHLGGMANTGANDFTDLWWNPAESGWGVSITQHGDNIFFRIFTYDTDGRPILFVVPGVTFNNSASSFTGAIQLTTGPWFGSNPFDPNQVVRTTAGSATLTFSDANNGVLTYTVNGITVTKAITRMVF